MILIVQRSLCHMIDKVSCFDLSQFCFAIVAPPGKVHKPSGQQKVILGWTDRDKAVEAYQHFEEAIKNVPSPSIGQVDSMRHQVRQAASTLCIHPLGTLARMAERPAAAPTSKGPYQHAILAAPKQQKMLSSAQTSLVPLWLVDCSAIVIMSYSHPCNTCCLALPFQGHSTPSACVRATKAKQGSQHQQ
jgi:hypothetical protein